MRVRDLMVENPITIGPDAAISDALELLKSRRIRHLPVVDAAGTLCGLLTLADLKEGLLPSMVSDVALPDLIIPNPVTVGPDDSVETAARRIYHHKISGMPVVADGRLVGILTETDILRTFIQMMGLLGGGARVVVALDDGVEALPRLIRTVQEAGGEITGLSLSEEASGERACHLRFASCRTATIAEALGAAGFPVRDAAD
jgi:acetoin utilization protein AcuB